MNLSIFYDGKCPLCMTEMRQLKTYDVNKKINFVDLNSIDFSENYPHIDINEALKTLHGQLESGELIHGLDVTCKAWDLVGKHKWLSILRWPIIRIFADAVYLFFAKYRNTISYMLTGKKPCQSCSLD